MRFWDSSGAELTLCEGNSLYANESGKRPKRRRPGKSGRGRLRASSTRITETSEADSRVRALGPRERLRASVVTRRRGRRPWSRVARNLRRFLPRQGGLGQVGLAGAGR